MTTNEMLKTTHLATVQKVAVQCAIDGSSKKAVEIGNAIIEYGKAWADGFADDGKLDEAEVGKIQEAFASVVNKYVPDIDSPAVAIVYDGIDSWFLRTFFKVEFKGLKHYFNKWFGLELK